MRAGQDPPGQALSLFFIEPLRGADAWSELAVKATPLALVGLGLAICFRANVWNIGAEGQFIVGALGATAVAMRAHAGVDGVPGTTALILPAIALAGIAAGAAWAAVVAFLRDRFHANEILVSLMLVYVADMLLGYLTYGPWRDPAGHELSADDHLLARSPRSRRRRGSRGPTSVCSAALLLAVGAWLVPVPHLRRAFACRSGGRRRAAARYAGFSARAIALDGADLLAAASRASPERWRSPDRSAAHAAPVAGVRLRRHHRGVRRAAAPVGDRAVVAVDVDAVSGWGVGAGGTAAARSVTVACSRAHCCSICSQRSCS